MVVSSFSIYSMEGGDGMSADPPSFSRMEGANMSATPPLNLVTPVQASQVHFTSMIYEAKFSGDILLTIILCIRFFLEI